MSLFQEISLDGVGEFESYSAQLFSLASILGDEGEMWGGLLAQIGDYFVEKVESNFDSAGAEVGGFVVLSSDYAAAFKGGDITPNLQLTGEYRASWGWDEYEDDAIIIHSEVEDTKHLWHEFGTRKMPMRPVLNLLDKDLAFIDENFCEAFDSTIFRRL